MSPESIAKWGAVIDSGPITFLCVVLLFAVGVLFKLYVRARDNQNAEILKVVTVLERFNAYVDEMRKTNDVVSKLVDYLEDAKRRDEEARRRRRETPHV